jgi:hypothetical protein
MLTKLAALVLAGSVAALTVARAVDLVHYFRHDRDADARWEGRHGKGRHRTRHVDARRVEVREEIASQEISSQAEGTYIFDESGDALGKFPWSAHAELELRPEGRYELRLRTNLENEMEEEHSWGRYRQQGDRLILYSASDDDRYEFRIEGDRLVFDADWKARIALKAAGITKTYMERQTQ